MTRKDIGLKSRVFIYYLQRTIGTRPTRKALNLPFLDDEEYTKYYNAAKSKLVESFGSDFSDMYDCFVKSEAANMLHIEAEKELKWLVENGYVYQKSYTNGGVVKTYTGITEKGLSVSGKYLEIAKLL